MSRTEPSFIAATSSPRSRPRLSERNAARADTIILWQFCCDHLGHISPLNFINNRWIFMPDEWDENERKRRAAFKKMGRPYEPMIYA